MSEQPSPGPWKALRGVDDDDTRWIVVAAGADREYLIATVENGQPGDCIETEAATASLIALAPEMADALRELLAAGEFAVTAEDDVAIMLRLGAATDTARALLARIDGPPSPERGEP